MAKLAQKRGMAGSNGKWKEFLKFYDKKFGTSLNDPSRRSIDSLAAFLKTFTQDDFQFFKKVLECHCNRNEVQEFKKVYPDNETTEQRLVRLTLEHSQYPIDYSFPSHEEDWLIIKRSKKSKAMKSTEMIAIDCEMVLCKDGTEALVKVCAVDRNLQVKLDEVVNPNKEIADYRTEITGISATDLDGVTYSLKDVQKSLKKLLSHGTILVGHSLNNDLQALKLAYTRVIDTSYVFKYANGLANKKPSLSLLCKAMLGYELRVQGNPHNCLDDACAAMKLVLARIEGRVNDVLAEVKESDTPKLLIHRIPANVPSQDLKSILGGDFTTKVKSKQKIKGTYAAFAIFKNQQEAVQAFENLEGDLEKDICGRLQKLVKFELDSGIAGTL
ncbi:3'-5' exonuclease [Handroanthus impetiginosus]|uniref:3'-5' exonuclease n=1 Tax=Handroanthus impetiginosus TaxID=429701 RepID=A0A2G9GVW8_9LAMI|nr:3'-5' exonuclease [Handroanthus impetiginosus]